MTALPIDPTGEQLKQVYDDAPGVREDVALEAVFQAGVEAERARAAAEATYEWGTEHHEGVGPVRLHKEQTARFIDATNERVRMVRRIAAGPWEVQS
jgi:hypothetical protein